MSDPQLPPVQPPLTTTALAERERQLTVMFDNIADVTFVVKVEDNGRLRFSFANKAFEKTTGVPFEKVQGRYLDEVIPEPMLALVLANYERAIRTRQRVVWEDISKYPTGRMMGEVSITPVHDEAGRCYQLVGVVHDLTKEKQAEEALRLSNERFAYALKATTDAVYDWDIADDVLFWSEGYEQLFGHTLSQNPMTLGQWTDYVHPDDIRALLLDLERAIYHSSDAIWVAEYRFQRADASWAFVLERGYILRDADGKAERLIGAMQDITPRKQAEAQQRLLTDRLLRQNSDLQQFTYIVSHNLRAPLANALGFTSLLTLVEADSPVFKTSVDNLRTSLRQLDQVLTDVTDVLSLRDEQSGYRPEPVVLAAVCAQAHLELREQLLACGGQLHCAIPEGLRLPGSRAYFHSIFHNLISNAIKYRSDDRPLQITVAAAAGPGQATTITIGDNGTGFDQKKAGDGIFQLYRRFHTGKPGRGIGLFLVKTHVEAMGGQIAVQSRVNEGTQFTLSFTCRTNENVPD